MRVLNMNRPDYKLYALDFTAKSPANTVTQEFGRRDGDEYENLVIPLNAPFYQESVKMYHPDGSKMDFGEDYDFYGIMPKLTGYTAKDVGLFIRLLKPEITEYYIDYQVVGNFNKITDEILNMLRTVAQDDRPVHWDNLENKPLWFDPELHQHDYAYNFFGFADLAQQLLRVQEFNSVFNNNVQVRLDNFRMRMDAYIAQYQSVLNKLLDSHDASKVDPHGVWKDRIGLGDVDNFKTATLQEVLDGLRDDLHIRPADAVEAVQMVAAQNERLFPAGTLPLLRYGSDSYIPPKIDGSFEGMGGSRQAIAAVVENDNTLMILQARNNGTTRGLYYYRCTRWETDRPIWDETGYRYVHPTATAAGATLDVIVNGSNQYIMVVGDSKLNKWWWCETFGTLNPARHVLRPITGAWVPNWVDNADGRLYLMADENYREMFVVSRAATGGAIQLGGRPSHPMPPGDRSGDGLMFYPCFALSTISDAAIIDYDIPGVKNYKDKFFTPHEQVLNANGEVTQGVFKSTLPLQSFWYYHSHYMQMRKMKEPAADGKARFGFMTELRSYFRTADMAADGTLLTLWRGTFTATPGATPTLQFKPGPNEKLYTINPKNPGGSPDWETLLLSKSWKYNISIGFFAGGVNFSSKYRLGVTSVNQITPPCEYRVFEDPGLASGEAMQLPYVNADVNMISNVMRDERNPVGQGIGFMYQYVGVGDSDNPNSGIVMARQLTTDADMTEWIGREMPFLKADWHADNSKITNMTIGGKTVRTFPLQPKSFKSNLGPAMLMSISAQTYGARANRRETWKNVFGADAFTNIDGEIKASIYTPGDGLLIAENNIKTINGVVNYIPTKVYRIDKAIIEKIKPLISALGMDVTNIHKAWTLSRIWDNNNNPLFILTITDAAKRTPTGTTDIRGTYAVVRVAPIGTPTTVNGYQYYADVNFTFVQPFVPPLFAGPINVRNVAPRAGYGRTDSTVQTFITENVPGVADPDGFCVLISTYHRYDLIGDTRGFDLFIEFRNDWTTSRIRNVSLSNTTYSTYAIDPYGGLGMTGNNVALTNGAGIITDSIIHSNQRFLDAIANNTFSPTPILGMSNLLQGGYTIYFKEIDNILIAGKKYQMTASYQDLRDHDPNPANKYFYIYLKYWMSGPAHVIETTPQPETSTTGLVAVVRTGPTQIEEIIPYNRFSMVGIQMSAVRQGGAVIGARGSIYEVGNASGILLPGDFLP